MDAMNNWIAMDVKRPGYGEPVLIVVYGVVQNIMYIRDGADDTEDWFEPYYFDDHELSAFMHDVSHWMPLPKFNAQNQLEINPYHLIEENHEKNI